MSLDISLSVVKRTYVFDINITHNLGQMAEVAGIYKHLWRPEELGIRRAGELVEPLKAGLALLKSDPERFKAYDAKNGWGIYDDFISWLEDYIVACEKYSDAEIEISK